MHILSNFPGAILQTKQKLVDRLIPKKPVVVQTKNAEPAHDSFMVGEKVQAFSSVPFLPEAQTKESSFPDPPKRSEVTKYLNRLDDLATDYVPKAEIKKAAQLISQMEPEQVASKEFLQTVVLTSHEFVGHGGEQLLHALEPHRQSGHLKVTGLREQSIKDVKFNSPWVDGNGLAYGPRPKPPSYSEVKQSLEDGTLPAIAEKLVDSELSAYGQVWDTVQLFCSRDEVMPRDAETVLKPLLFNSARNAHDYNKMAVEKLGPRRTLELLEQRNEERSTRIWSYPLEEAFQNGFKPERGDVEWIVKDLVRPEKKLTDGAQDRILDRTRFLGHALEKDPMLLEGFRTEDGADFRDALLDRLISEPSSNLADKATLISPDEPLSGGGVLSKVLFSGVYGPARVQRALNRLEKASQDQPAEFELLASLLSSAPRDAKQSAQFDRTLDINEGMLSHNPTVERACKSDRLWRKIHGQNDTKLVENYHSLKTEAGERYRSTLRRRLVSEASDSAKNLFVKAGENVEQNVLDAAKNGKLGLAIECLEASLDPNNGENLFNSADGALDPVTIRENAETLRGIRKSLRHSPFRSDYQERAEFEWEIFSSIRPLLSDELPRDKVLKHLSSLGPRIRDRQSAADILQKYSMLVLADTGSLDEQVYAL